MYCRYASLFPILNLSSYFIPSLYQAITKMADKSMHHYAMEGNGNGATDGGQFVVTVCPEVKLMQVREPLFMPSSSGVPTLAGGKREELNSNLAVS